MYEGEAATAKDNSFLGKIELTNIHKAVKGATQIEVTFDVDNDRHLCLSAVVKPSKKGQKITINMDQDFSPSAIFPDQAVAENS